MKSLKAYYDLSVMPATYDFLTWVCNAKTLGATEVVFDVSKGFQKKKFSAGIARQMYENVLQPACELWGLPHSEGTNGDSTPGYFFSDLIETFENHGRIAGPQWPGELNVDYTITIRDSIRNQHRNSNRAAWVRVADEISARIIDDAYTAPIDLKYRYCMYASAKMNFFVTNGPMVLCAYSDAPYIMFAKEPMVQQSWTGSRGFQFPWANENQRIAWRDDTYENIIDEFRKTGRVHRDVQKAATL